MKLIASSISLTAQNQVGYPKPSRLPKAKYANQNKVCYQKQCSLLKTMKGYPEPGRLPTTSGLYYSSNNVSKLIIDPYLQGDGHFFFNVVLIEHVCLTNFVGQERHIQTKSVISLVTVNDRPQESSREFETTKLYCKSDSNQ